MPARCPTCDREECPTLTQTDHIDAHRLDCPACVAADDCAAHAAARLERDRADAARWRKVAPLIEALHQASMIEAGDPMHVVDAAMELLAATQEPTP